MPLDGISLQIERLAKSAKISHIEATLHYFKKFELDPDDAKELLHPNILEAIKTEFVQLNHIPGMKKEVSLEKFFG